MDDELLRAADRTARRLKMNRSALMRKALREYLKRLAFQEQEARDRQGYARHPDTMDQLESWEEVAAWPQR